MDLPIGSSFPNTLLANVREMTTEFFSFRTDFGVPASSGNGKNLKKFSSTIDAFWRSV